MFGRTLAVMFIVWLAIVSACLADFSFDDNGTSLTVLDNGNPVLSYNYGRMDPPEGADKERYWRSCYIHPVCGLDGDVLTGDFQSDHLHHRGLFWAWPKCVLGEQEVDEWHLVKVRQHFERWLAREAGTDEAEVAVQNVWRLDNDLEPWVRETIRFTVHPVEDNGRAVDFHMEFANVSEEVVTVKGQNKAGYGGFSLRPDGARPDRVITTAKGVLKKDTDLIDTPWADHSSRVKPGGPVSGVAIFQHPGNPGYPHSGWTLRHYGFLGAAWPHDEPVKLDPGDSFELRYRLYIHRGTAEDADLAAKYEAYVTKTK
jgi:hypothetical protein